MSTRFPKSWTTPRPTVTQRADRTRPPVYAFIRAVVVDRRGVRSVQVECPYCAKVHVHGWPETAELPLTRSAHCRDAPLGASYLIRYPPKDAQ